MLVRKLIRRWRKQRALRFGYVSLDPSVEGTLIRILALDYYEEEVGRCIGLWEASRKDALLSDVWVSESWRCRGVGAGLLNAFLLEAKHLGALLVHGSIVQMDLDRTPGLLAWYEKLGFAAVPVTSDEIGPAVVRVENHLGKSTPSSYSSSGKS